MNRRRFLASSSVVLADQMFSHGGPAWASKARAHYTLRIEPCKLEIAPGIVIDTIGYNGQVPGPILRVREGVPVIIDVTNSTANADIVHWHGLAIDSLNDGAMEEGSPMIPAGRTLRYHVMPLDSVAVDFVADNPGDTLLHCHQALHMDFGFMQLMKYVG
jgi:FtsP/CotA-like multicopper oxidase with cupredoxin domain